MLKSRGYNNKNIESKYFSHINLGGRTKLGDNSFYKSAMNQALNEKIEEKSEDKKDDKKETKKDENKK